VPASVLAIWSLALVLKWLAVYRLANKGLFNTLPIFWAYVLISVTRSTVLLFYANDWQRYPVIAADSMPMALLSEAFAITSVYWLVTENFPRWRKPGTISLAALAILGAVSALLLKSVGVPKDWGYGAMRIWDGVMLLQRHGMTMMAVVLAGVRFLLTLVRFVPVRPVARRAVDVLTMDVLMGMSISLVNMAFRDRFPMITFLFPVSCGVVNGFLWAFWLPAVSEEREVKRPRWRGAEESINWRDCFADLVGRIRLQFTEKA